MGDLREGGKLGALLGLLCGSFTGAMVFLHGRLNPIYVAYLPSRDFVQVLLASTIVGGAFGALAGALFGIGFARGRRRLPGRSMTQKAIVSSLLLWAVGQGIIVPTSFQSYLISWFLYHTTSMILLWVGVFMTLTFAIAAVFGASFGYVFDRELRKEPLGITRSLGTESAKAVLAVLAGVLLVMIGAWTVAFLYYQGETRVYKIGVVWVLHLGVASVVAGIFLILAARYRAL